jgi:hypothetical protein
MFMGHCSAALAVKTLLPRSSLPLLFLFTQAQDVLLVLIGAAVRLDTVLAPVVPPNAFFEHVPVRDAPYSHALLSTAIATALAFALTSRTATARGRRTGSLLAHPAAPYALTAAAHLLVDALARSPAVTNPCWPMSTACPRVALGVWRHLYPSVALETAVILSAFALCMAADVYFDFRRRDCFPGMAAARMGRGTAAFGLTLALTGLMVLATANSTPHAESPPPVDFAFVTAKSFVYSVLVALAWILEASWQRQRSTAPAKVE